MLHCVARCVKQSLRHLSSPTFRSCTKIGLSPLLHLSPFPRQQDYDFARIIGATALATAYGSTAHAEPERQQAEDQVQDITPVGSSHTRGWRLIFHPELPEAVRHVTWTAICEAKESGVLALITSVVAINTSVTAAFALGSRLRCIARPKPQLFRFMSKNFILSAARLRRGRWHVLLTCAFTHLNRRHFNRNVIGLVGGIAICSAFMSVQEIVALFVASSFVGGLLSVSALTTLTKVPYRIVGGSDAMMGLIAFYLCREDRDSLPIPPSVLKCMCGALVLYEMLGVSGLVRYGKMTSGSYGLVDNVAHAGGAFTGIAACVFMQRTRVAQVSNSGNNDTSSERPEADSLSQGMIEDRST